MPENIIIIDSAKRDIRFPSNSKFTYNTNKIYVNPSKLSLIGAIVANSQYIINSNNCNFNVTSGLTYTATLTQQNYTPTSIATELQNKLNALAIPATTFTVTSNFNTNKLTINSSSSVLYNFSMNILLSQLLGFPLIDSGLNTTITSTNVMNISTTRYYKLTIRELLANYDTNISGSFNFIIPNNANAGIFNYLTNDSNVDNSLNIDNQINLCSLRIELFDEWDNLVQLNGVDYLLTFKIFT